MHVQPQPYYGLRHTEDILQDVGLCIWTNMSRKHTALIMYSSDMEIAVAWGNILSEAVALNM